MERLREFLLVELSEKRAQTCIVKKCIWIFKLYFHSVDTTGFMALRQSSVNWHIKQLHCHCSITRRETWHSGGKTQLHKEGKKIHILSPKWGLQNSLYPAQWARLNFHLCLHFEANSLRLLSVVLGFDNPITSFSCKHGSHRRAPFLYA